MRLLRSDAAWLSERAAWLEKLEVVLERKPGWEQRLRDAVVANRESLPSDYVRIYENNMEVIFAAVAELLNERSERQTKYLQSRLAELREDFETLIAQGNRSTGVTAG